MGKENKCSNNDLLLQHEIELLQGMMESKENYRKIVQAGIARWVKDFQAGRIVVNTVDDLDKLIRMDLRLQRDE